MNVVTGLRRSGTSLLMYALKEAGFDIVGSKYEDVGPSTKEGNPNGYWEVKGVTSEGGLVEDLGKGEVVKVMFEALPLSKPELIDKTIVIFREPRCVLQSVMNYDVIFPDLYIVKACLDIIDTLEFLQDKPHKIVFYEDIIKRPVSEMKAICKFLGKGDYKKAAKVVDKKLNRSEPTMGDHRYMDLWEKFYLFVRNNEVKETFFYKSHLEHEAIVMLEKHDKKN